MNNQPSGIITSRSDQLRFSGKICEAMRNSSLVEKGVAIISGPRSAFITMSM